MKLSTLAFIALVAALAFFFLRSDPAKVIVKDGVLRFYTHGCDYQIPVQSKNVETKVIDKFSIYRETFELPNGDEIILERVSLPSQYSFSQPYESILEEVFKTKIDEIYSREGFALYKGDFLIALFEKSDHDIVLIYPADDLQNAFINCFEENTQSGLLKKSIPLHKSEWRMKQIVLDGLISEGI